MFKKEIKSVKKLICNFCNKKCLGKVLRVNEKHFHDQCFLCSICNTSLSTDGYFQKNNSYFCIADYQKMFGHKCSTCFEYIEGEMVLIMDKSYHVECFNCSKCKQILQDGSRIINIGEEILCENCIVCNEIVKIDEHENSYDSLVWPPHQQSDIENTTNSGESNLSYQSNNVEKCFSYLNMDQSFLKKIVTPYGKTKNLSHFHRPAKVQSSSNRRLYPRKKLNIDPIIKMSTYPDGKKDDSEIQIKTLDNSQTGTDGMLSLFTKNPIVKSNRKFKQESFDIRTASRHPSGSEEYMSTLDSPSSIEEDVHFYEDDEQSKKIEVFDTTNKLSTSDFSSGKLENSNEYSVSISDSSYYSIPYEMLVTTNKRLPDNVDRCNLERHLSETEFLEVLKCSRMDFYSLPLWKRNDIKRKGLIF